MPVNETQVYDILSLEQDFKTTKTRLETNMHRVLVVLKGLSLNISIFDDDNLKKLLSYT